MSHLTFVTKVGSEILDIQFDFAQLRIEVFKDFPYLYEGSIEYELEYIKTYSNAPNAFVFAIYDGNKMIGATTCVPMIHETPNVKACFEEAGIPINQVCYFGESILLKEYRGNGYGHLFFEEREKYALSLDDTITICTFCAVNRPENHPLKPADYRSNNAFWEKRGYTEHKELQCTMSWQDIDKPVEDEKTLTFWTKRIR